MWRPVLLITALGVSACAPPGYTPAARMITLETATAPAPGQTDVQLDLAGASAIFGPEIMNADAQHGVADPQRRVRAHLTAIPAAERLRTAPQPGMVSTIEAIATALRLVESDAVAEPLERLFAVAVEHARRAGRRSSAATG